MPGPASFLPSGSWKREEQRSRHPLLVVHLLLFMICNASVGPKLAGPDDSFMPKRSAARRNPGVGAMSLPASHRSVRFIAAAAPLLLSMLLVPLLAGPLSFGGGEKDVLLAFPFLV